jgi:hypothetical protein
LDSSTASDLVVLLAWRGAEIAALCAAAMLGSALIVRRLAQRRDRMRFHLAQQWRPLLTRIALEGGDEALRVSPPHRRHMAVVMEEWNSFQDALRGAPTARLNELARRIGIDAAARRLLQAQGLGARILAIRTLGHLGDPADWSALQSQLVAPNALLSFYAAAALIQIDAQRAMPGIMLQLAEREDWPGEAIAGLLKEAGTQVTREPIRALILSLEQTKVAPLLPWLGRADPVLANEIGALLLRREPQDPRVAAAALLLVQDPALLPHIRGLAASTEAEVRKNLAIALGRLGDLGEVPLLITLLSDAVWWVRYRAAQALVRLRGMSSQRLDGLRAHLTDRYAHDMLDHVRAEGLAT